MTRNVKVTLSGTQTGSGMEDAGSVEQVWPANYYQKNGKHYLVYEERDADTGEHTKALLKFTDQMLQIHRRGRSESELLFECGRQTKGTYRTPAGDLSLEISATEIELFEKEEEIHCELRYSLHLGGGEENCRLSMHIVPDEEG